MEGGTWFFGLRVSWPSAGARRRLLRAADSLSESFCSPLQSFPSVLLDLSLLLSSQLIGHVEGLGCWELLQMTA